MSNVNGRHEMNPASEDSRKRPGVTCSALMGRFEGESGVGWGGVGGWLTRVAPNWIIPRSCPPFASIRFAVAGDLGHLSAGGRVRPPSCHLAETRHNSRTGNARCVTNLCIGISKSSIYEYQWSRPRPPASLPALWRTHSQRENRDIK